MKNKNMNIKITSSEQTLIKEALLDLQNGLVGKGEKYKAITNILNKMEPTPKVPRVLNSKLYMFTFVGGGWNSIWAKTKKGAIKAGNNKYKNEPKLNIIQSSFVLASTNGLQTAMSTFY
jgi:hypothetical protein